MLDAILDLALFTSVDGNVYQVMLTLRLKKNIRRCLIKAFAQPGLRANDVTFFLGCLNSHHIILYYFCKLVLSCNILVYVSNMFIVDNNLARR